MKSQIFRGVILVLTFMFVMLITGCGNDRYIVTNKKADNEMSQAIYDQLGKRMCYHNSSFNKNEEISYYFYIVNDYKDENLLEEMANTVNEKLKENDIKTRICLVIWEVIPGGTRTMVCLSNYYENDSVYESYETLQCLKIWGAESGYETYNKVSAYENLMDIKALIVEKRINKIWEEEGIDWYEVWPDLEHYDIFNEYGTSGD